MLCRVTNNQKGPRVIYNVKRRPVTIEPGQSVKIDLDEDTYETHRAMSLAQVGPHIELLEEGPQPQLAEPPPQSIPPQSEDEDTGEDVLGEPESEPVFEPEPEPIRRRRTTRRPAKRKTRTRAHASAQME